MKNRIASLFLVFALLMSLCNFAVARDNRITVQSGGAERFTDVPTSHWAYGYIDKVVGSGLFNGKTPTTFEPSNAMTRSQFVMVMARMEGRSDLEGVETQTRFPDVTTTRRAAGPIAWATEEGFVNGFGDGTFKPDSPITRGQFAALIHRYIVAKRYVNLHPVEPEPAQFTDAASVSSAFTEDVEYARILGLLTGYSDGTVRAGNPITRAAIAAILARFLDLVTESGYTPLLDGPVIDGGDSGDSGDSSSGSSVEYDDVKLTVSGSTHGKTTLKVTRDGKEVAADDVQAGDLVTVTHEPDSGYSVSIRVRDAKNKTVKKTTNNKTYTTTFTVPKTNLPVTVTVTYSKTSSGGGGGGGGGNTGGGGGGNPIVNPPTPTKDYTLVLQAGVAASTDNATHGKLSVWTEEPKEGEKYKTFDTSVSTKSPIGTKSATTAPDFEAYVVFVPDDANYELKPENVTVNPDSAWVKTDGALKTVTASVGDTDDDAVDQTLYYVHIKMAGVETSANPDVTVTGMFTLIDNGSSTADKYTWTITPTVTNGSIGIYGNQADRDALTAPLQANVGLTNGSAQFAELAKDASKTVYVAVSPGAFYDGTGFELLSSANATLSTGVDKLGNGTLYFYDLTLTGITANVTTTLSGAFKEYENAPPIGKSVTVTAQYLDANDAPIDTPKGAQTPEPDKLMALKDEDVTVSVPVTPVDGYSLQSVTLNGNAITPEDNDPTLTTWKYSFKMPDADAEVVVTYKALPADDLEDYNINVTFVGEGSIALNVAGKEYMFSSDGKTTDTFQLRPSEYATQYPNGIPAYLVSAIPATAKGFVFPKEDADRITPARIRDSKPSEPAKEATDTTPAKAAVDNSDTWDYSLTNENKTLNVTVKFVREYSYAYNLTVIGQGSANVTLNGTDFKSAASGSVISRSDSATLVVKATEGDGEKPVQSVLINDETVTHNATSGASYTMQPGTAEIVVAFLPDTDTIVPFSVTLDGSGAVKIRAENGPIVDGAIPADNDTAKSNLDKATKREASVSATSTTYTGYAWLGTIITLTPDLGDNVVVDSIKVDNQNRSDELSSNGFSYTLADGKDNAMVVTTSTFGGYSLLAQAPYMGAFAADNALYSFSQVDSNGEKNDPAKQATLQQILYSLNNGRDGTTESKLDQIRNNLCSTLGALSKIIQLYLYNPSDELLTESGQKLEERINKGVASSITANIGNMIASQKDAMINAAKDDVDDELKDLNVTVPNATELANRIKPEIIRQIMNDASTPYNVRNAYASGEITETDFIIGGEDINKPLVVIPLIKTTDEQDTRIVDKNRATGKSVQEQITRKFLKEYLDNPKYVDVVVGDEPATAENMGLDPKVELKELGAAGGVTSISISASAAVENAPTLKLSSFKDFMAPNGKLDLDVWAVIKVSVGVRMSGKTETLRENQEIFEQVTLDDTKTITELLDKVDAQLSQTRAAKQAQLTSTQNGQTVLNITLGDVITKDMIETIIKGSEDGTVEGILTPILNKLSVESLGDATATRSKVLGIYDDLVEFKPKEGSDKLDKLQIKNKTNEYKTLLAVKDNGLLLTIDFPGFFTERGSNVDVSDENGVKNADQTSFELLVDSMIGLRDAIATDIRNTNNESPQVAISKLILGQLSSNKRVVTVKKWGKTIPSTGMSDAEKKEVANLLAELIMQEDLTTTTLHGAWANFEAKGYSSIEFKSIGLPGGDLGNALTANAVKLFNVDFEANPTLVGIKLERTLKTPATN